MPATLPDRSRFQKDLDGNAIDLLILKNRHNQQAAITNYGARWVSFLTPDRWGMRQDVVVGFESIESYLQSTEAYYGATVGRCANRIRNGRFQLDGKECQLTQNKGSHHLHGGKSGFQAAIWAFEKVETDSVTLFYQSPDGEEGYPGNLQVRVVYTLTNENALRIDFEAQTDATTIVNLTNHAFFNLNGQGNSDIRDHLLYINAGQYTPMDADSIPTGAIESVEGTPFDFNTPTTMGARINTNNVQLKNGNGYDHNFVLNKTGNELAHAATAIGDKSGIRMDVTTTEPGMQLYTGNFMNGSNTIEGGVKDAFRTAFCLETQHFPDAPNQPGFPSIVLRPGQTFSSTTLFRFSVSA